MKLNKLIGLLSITLATGSLVGLGAFDNSVLPARAETDYYASIRDDMKGDTLKVALYQIIKGHTKVSYNSLEESMRYTDRDWTLSPDRNEKDPYMVLLYADYNESKPVRWSYSQGSYGKSSGYVWNKEHIWAKSNGFPTSSAPAYSDLHHLRASDWKCNNLRSNSPFNTVLSGSYAENAYGKSSQNKYTSSMFEPADEYKGDVARALFYMATRYYNGDGSSGTHLTLTTGTDSSGGKWGYLDTLLAWHVSDPVDEFETRRNDEIYKIQHNRNPYVDHPEYARAVFKDEYIEEPHTLESLEVTGTLQKFIYKEGDAFDPTGLTVIATYDDLQREDVTKRVSWEPSPLVAGCTTVTGTYKDKTVKVNGLTVSPINSIEIIGEASKTSYEEGDSFNPAGLTVNAVYSPTMKTDVTSKVVWTPNPLTEGTTSVTANFAGKTAVYSGITVSEKTSREYTIKFGDNGSDDGSVMSSDDIMDYTDEGSQYITKFSSITKIYKGSQGLKFGSGSGGGSLTINLNSTGSTTIDKISITAKEYSSNGVKVTVKTNFDSTGKSFEPTSSMDTYDLAFTGLVSTITISSDTRCYIKSISLSSGSGGKVLVEDVALDVNETTLDLNGTYTKQLNANITPSDATNKALIWTSTNPSVVSVNNGYLTGLKLGSAIIEVSTVDGGYSDTCVVTVINTSTELIPVEGVSLSTTSAELKPGNVLTLTATITPINATHKTITWTTDNYTVASVSSSGIVQALSVGSAHITATTEEGGFSATCTIIVSSDQVVSVTGITFGISNPTVRVGRTLTLLININPFNATNKMVTWSSENTNIATVDQNGVVTGVSKGMTKITVVSVESGVSASCILNVADNPTPAPASSGGCGGSIETTSIILSAISLIGIILFLVRKKEYNK